MTGLLREAAPEVVEDVLRTSTETGQFAADNRIMDLAAMGDAELRDAVGPLSRDHLAVSEQLAGVGTPQWWQTVKLGDFAATLAQVEEWRHLSPTAQHAWTRINQRLAEARLLRLDEIGSYVTAEAVDELTPRLESAHLRAVIAGHETAPAAAAPVPAGPTAGPTLADLIAARRNLEAAAQSTAAAGLTDARTAHRVAEQDLHQLAGIAYAQGHLTPEQVRDATGATSSPSTCPACRRPTRPG